MEGRHLVVGRGMGRVPDLWAGPRWVGPYGSGTGVVDRRCWRYCGLGHCPALRAGAVVVALRLWTGPLASAVGRRCEPGRWPALLAGAVDRRCEAALVWPGMWLRSSEPALWAGAVSRWPAL